MSRGYFIGRVRVVARMVAQPAQGADEDDAGAHEGEAGATGVTSRGEHYCGQHMCIQTCHSKLAYLSPGGS